MDLPCNACGEERRDDDGSELKLEGYRWLLHLLSRPRGLSGRFRDGCKALSAEYSHLIAIWP